ncbi:hypothetical protein [Flavobacterium sp. AG291]|uniref:hypothetical protein n=1 Tax=Flavobacterium sp. AG291 TaxID=2184000 RepID=UPI000E0C4487|nr:hypothetical protein [Flavobacterium sp. AG291]RDI07050.1 hypothetical protein DEU42_113150 [Flavobacterium sp. AG291]
MKFKKPSEQKVKDTIALTGGVVAGGMVSKAAFGFLHEPTTATDTASLKKDENTALMKRGALVLAGAAGAMFLDGTDSLSTLAKGTFVGVAVAQSLEIIAVLAKRSGVESESTASTSGKKAVARALGLGCPCTETPALNATVDFAPRYDLSNMDFHPSGDGLNGWGGSDESGLLGWGSLELKSA